MTETEQNVPRWVLPLLLAAVLVVVLGVALAVLELSGRADILLALA
ncbi:MAG: hypothetical protein ABEI80_08445 [Haloplanus sp.]